MNPMRKTVLLTLISALFCFALPATAKHAAVAHVYTMSNAVDGNEILVFAHNRFAGLHQVASVATGGTGGGNGSALGNQGGLIASDDNRLLFAVNVGSNSVSVLQLSANGLELVGAFDSGGEQPVSLTQHGDLLYVLNAGSDSIAGFTIEDDATLTPLAGSIQSLSGTGTAPAQISFTPWGDKLIVTEKATSLIDTFVLNDDGVPTAAVFTPSAGTTPFGFGFDRFGNLLVTEAFGGAPDASTVSSYAVEEDGAVTVLDAEVPNTETAACWLVTSRNGRVSFVTNTGSGTISAYKSFRDGRLRLTTDDGVTASTGAGSNPIDLSLSGNGHFLYALSASTGEIRAFRVLGKRLRPAGGTQGLPVSTNGLVAF